MKAISEEEMMELGIRQVNRWRADWNAFAREALGANLDAEQQAILSSVQHNPRTSVSSGTARGKDFVAACCALCFMYLTPIWDDDETLIANTKVALTAPTDRQVKNIMMPEVKRLYFAAKKRGIVLPGRPNIYDIRTDSDEWFLTGFKADEYNHEAWSGFHAVNTMFIATEATGLGESTFAAIEGNLQGNSRLLLVFNPNTTIGYAARSQKEPRWNAFRLNSLTAPNVVEHKIIIPGQVDYEWVQDKLENWCERIPVEDVKAELDDFEFEGQWYRPEDLFRIKVLGLFPKVPEDILIPQQWIELAEARWKEATEAQRAGSGTTVIGCDVAGMGRDSTVYVPRRENVILFVKKKHSGGKADHMAVAGELKHMMDQDPNAVCSIDTIGEGAGVYSRVVEMGYEERSMSCKYSESAKDAFGNDLTDITGQLKFANMRAFLFWAVRDWLDPKNHKNAMLPPNTSIGQEASEIKWLFRSDGRIIIEPKEDIKKRLGKSTDEFDALANTFYHSNAFVYENLDHMEEDIY